MNPRRIRSFWHDEQAAISTLYAVGILALVGIAGVGFDYGRLMALNSELQNAADQAALAAATQLDGRDGAMQRARDAATNALASTASSYVNETRFANDGSGRPITGLTFRFFDGYANDATGNLLTSDSDAPKARVVEVTVNARKVFYALTPVIGAFNSGDVKGRALAGLQSATCDVPPMMFCAPPDATGAVNAAFPTAADIGKGLKLHFKTNGSASPGNPNQQTTDTTAWAPGNFGFLDLDYLPKSGQNTTAGLNSNAFGCTGTPPNSNPGFRTPQGSALNSRFDLYPPPTNTCGSNGDFCPSTNVRKNLVLQMPKGAKDCSNPPKNPKWSDWTDPTTVGIPDPGYPQDTNFAGNPNAVIGNGDWGAAAWLSSNQGASLSNIPDVNGDGRISRYEVYLWEQDSAYPGRLAPKFFTGSDGNSYCSFPQPISAPPGIAASSTQKDRRILTVAAVDCTNLTGKAPVTILRWVDLFLVQPVTSDNTDFFTEIIGPAKKANGDSGFQYYGRKKAVLIR